VNREGITSFTEVGTSAPRTDAKPQFRCGIDGAEPPKITSAPTENYFHLNGNIVPF